ncbi:MAG: hypothetical protein NTY38_02075, partial [Acidobacteria bacterium]|nr:hypothetical protein [Acidobacteriota bacterium]
IITTVAGTGERGDGPDGDPLRAKLARPHGIDVDRFGNVYIGDSENHRVRMIHEVLAPGSRVPQPPLPQTHRPAAPPILPPVATPGLETPRPKMTPPAPFRGRLLKKSL